MRPDRRRLLAGLALCPLCFSAARAAEGHWSYEGHGGPEEWGGLDENFRACAIGRQQSPIDLEGAVEADAPRPKLAWTAQAFEIVNNGHTIQADVVKTEDGSRAELKGETYLLKQFHFHAPSEHALAGKRTAMEAHFVHAAPSGNLVVVGVLMAPGGANAAFSEVMAKAPAKVGPGGALRLDPSAFLPASPASYRYEGSLTTPPCSEIVDWMVFATPIEVAEADIARFKAIFPMNARPLQAVNRRFLLQLR